jgi:hypothetical protein
MEEEYDHEDIKMNNRSIRINFGTVAHIILINRTIVRDVMTHRFLLGSGR